MKKILLVILMIGLMTTPCLASQWLNANTAFQDGDTTYIGDIDTDLTNYVVDPLDRMLAGYRKGMTITYSSATEMTVSAGAVMVSNTAGTIRLMLRNTSSTTLTWANIDTGAKANNTYYVYAIAATSAAETATFKISLSPTLTAGADFYKKIGSFYNNSSSNISYISNNDGNAYEYVEPYSLSEGTSYSAGVSYQNTTGHKLLINAYGIEALASSWYRIDYSGKIGETSAGTTVSRVFRETGSTVHGANVFNFPMTFIVPQGYYFTISVTYGTITRIEAWEI